MHAAEAENQVEADDRDRKNQRPAQQVEIKRLVGPFEQQRRRRQ
jgi:hypothetical protein